MSIRACIKNDEPEGTEGTLSITVMTVGNTGEEEQQLYLAAQQSVCINVAPDQFVLVDERDDPSGQKARG